MEISIQIFNDDGEIIGQRTTQDWDIAEQNLESLKKHFKDLDEQRSALFNPTSNLD